ncbi:MSMEG_1061 family FMN-dependent PPOX-type flavoprotein [Lentzea sp. CA-135723]|uniref:MSMEG_1061 family FMN-dependent PPOX-type flavoprotein n=1 Tax=Lentzea sp. CA-135723 TaxID=3239950 RepID=UPI003D925FCC
MTGTPIRGLDELRALVPEPLPHLRDKAISVVDEGSRRFIEASTFYLFATTGADGSVDVSPRGDPAGSVRILDSRTLAFADRPGNRRLDSFRNVLEHPRAGMLFLVAGRLEVLRVNGTVTLVRDAPFLLEYSEPTPVLGVVLRVEELFLHCGQALRRSSLWDADGWPAEDAVPPFADLVASQQRYRGQSGTSALK